jgi:PAS domain S-box-containing protein
MNTKTDAFQDRPEILIVEDSPTQAESLKHLLQRKGYRVMVADDGDQALEFLGERKPTLVITDILMPGMDGYELCKRIKSDEINGDIPVILLTSLANSEDVLEGLACGADNFITKPYSEEYLLSIISKILANRNLHKSERVRIGVEVVIGGKSRFITADQQQMLSLLLSTYEAAVHRNTELIQTQDQLRSLNERLEDIVQERTAQLSKEILERKSAEERERHLNIILRSIRNVNQLITIERDRERLIQGACKNLVSTQGLRHAWISLMDGPDSNVIVGESGLGDHFIKLRELFEQGHLPLCAQKALSQSGIVVTEDISICVECPIESFCREGVAFSLRLEHGGKVYGILTASVSPVYAKEKEDQELFEEIGGDISFALYNIEQEEKHVEDERKIFEQEERFRAIFESASEGILITETQTIRIKYVNPTMCQMLGYTKHELEHMTIKDIHPPEVMDQVISEFKTYERENKPIFHQDAPCLKKDGTIIYTDIVTTPRIIIDGRPHSATFFLDITQRKKAEDDKKKMEAQLIESQKLEAVGRLTGGIAHDFNNILTTIIGNAHIILTEAPKGDPIREGLEEIKAAGNRATLLTHQLLAFSRKQILQPKIINLNETVNNMDKMLRRIIGEDIELMTILAPDLGQVEADPGQIEQVMMNLVVNARDAMLKGGKITIETANMDFNEEYARDHISVTPGPYVMLSVSDTGIGMTREIQEQLFEPFFTTKEKGTGLGLSTAYGIVKQSNGNIWVYSEPGKGATFKVYLPRVKKSMGKEIKDKKPKFLTGSETILVVEDDEEVRNVTVKILKRFGYIILIAADGREAIRISGDHEGPIHLMLTDVVMPDMSGGDLVEKLRASRPEMKTLYMSGYTDNAIIHHGILDRRKAFIQKPFTPDFLGLKVREILDK